MTKLAYQKNGLYPNCSGYIDDNSNDLYIAISNCNFDIPSDFSQKDYLDKLEDTISSYRDENNSIGSKIKTTDKRYQNLSDNLVSSAAKLTSKKINKRSRMII